VPEPISGSPGNDGLTPVLLEGTPLAAVFSTALPSGGIVAHFGSRKPIAAAAHRCAGLGRIWGRRYSRSRAQLQGQHRLLVGLACFGPARSDLALNEFTLHRECLSMR
jgi:hypothetical protein